MATVSGTPVDAYIRVSRLGDRRVGSDSFISPEEQLKAIQDECQRSGLRVMETWEELDESGGNAKRPLWNKAIERVESRTTRGIVVWRFDRFARSGKDALAAVDRIERSGGKLYSASEQTDNSVAGVFTRNMFFLIAEMERGKEGLCGEASSSPCPRRSSVVSGPSRLRRRFGRGKRLLSGRRTLLAAVCLTSLLSGERAGKRSVIACERLASIVE